MKVVQWKLFFNKNTSPTALNNDVQSSPLGSNCFFSAHSYEECRSAVFRIIRFALKSAWFRNQPILIRWVPQNNLRNDSLLCTKDFTGNSLLRFPSAVDFACHVGFKQVKPGVYPESLRIQHQIRHRGHSQQASWMICLHSTTIIIVLWTSRNRQICCSWCQVWLSACSVTPYQGLLKARSKGYVFSFGNLRPNPQWTTATCTTDGTNWSWRERREGEEENKEVQSFRNCPHCQNCDIAGKRHREVTLKESWFRVGIDQEDCCSSTSFMTKFLSFSEHFSVSFSFWDSCVALTCGRRSGRTFRKKEPCPARCWRVNCPHCTQLRCLVSVLRETKEFCRVRMVDSKTNVCETKGNDHSPLARIKEKTKSNIWCPKNQLLPWNTNPEDFGQLRLSGRSDTLTS